MRRYSCKIISEKITDECGAVYTVYGLEIGKPYSVMYRDLCTDKEKIENLAASISEYCPDPVSLPGIIDDFLFTT